MGKPHNIWKICGSELYAVKRAGIKSNIACGTYTLQIDRSKFSAWKTNPLCLLCLKEPEDLCHFLKCKSLEDTRYKFIQIIRNVLEKSMHSQVVYELTQSEDKLLQLIVDCTKCHFLHNCHAELEKITSSMCYAWHLKRTGLLVWLFIQLLYHREVLLCNSSGVSN
jgi:hypothetical protein